MNACETEFFEGRESSQGALAAEASNVNRHILRACVLFSVRQQHHHPFEAKGKTYGRRSWSSERLNKSIVASAGADRILCAEIGRSDLKCRKVIVIETPYKPVVQSIGNLDEIKASKYLGEVRPG